MSHFFWVGPSRDGRTRVFKPVSEIFGHALPRFGTSHQCENGKKNYLIIIFFAKHFWLNLWKERFLWILIWLAWNWFWSSYQIRKTELWLLPGAILIGSSVLRRLRMTHSAYLSRKGKLTVKYFREKEWVLAVDG